MNKKLLKTLTGLAIVGTALGAASAYIKNAAGNYIVTVHSVLSNTLRDAQDLC